MNELCYIIIVLQPKGWIATVRYMYTIKYNIINMLHKMLHKMLSMIIT